MNNIEFKHIITNAVYTTKYEPIVDTKNDKIYAYEALSKFNIDNRVISTEEIFRQLHHNNELFFNLEVRNKELQVTHFDMNTKLFLNFDADIFVTNEQQIYWEHFLNQYKTNLVVEITENGSDDETSSQTMKDFANWLGDKNIPTALDDFAQDGSMFSFHIMNRCQYIKIDKSFLRQIALNKNYIHYLKGLLQTIKMNNQKSIIEGVETQEDYELVKKIGCDYMQGFYFKNQVITK